MPKIDFRVLRLHSFAALPSTGGPGTALTYLLGSLLITLTGLALLARRRMGKAA